MKTLLKQSGWLLAASVLAGCADRSMEFTGNPVEVSFAQPFPAGGADAAGFAARDRGRYAVADDTTSMLLVSQYQVVKQRAETIEIPTILLDSLGLPRRAGLATGRYGEQFQVLALTPDSCRLHYLMPDTLVQLTGAKAAHLRRYRGWYYLNTPADSGRWQVERLAVVGRQLHWQEFGRDSLRIWALEPSTIQLKRDDGRLLFTLAPRSGLATRQVNEYAGLWLTKGEYLRRRR